MAVSSYADVIDKTAAEPMEKFQGGVVGEDVDFKGLLREIDKSVDVGASDIAVSGGAEEFYAFVG